MSRLTAALAVALTALGVGPAAGSPMAAKGTQADAIALFAMPEVFVRPAEWTEKPSPEDLARFYPMLESELIRGAYMCRVRADGRLAGCRAFGRGEGSAAALDAAAPVLLAKFRAPEVTRHQMRTEGVTAIVPLVLGPPGAASPAGGFAAGEETFWAPVPWTVRPSKAEWIAAYPSEGRGRRGGGTFVCTVGDDGELTNCLASGQSDDPVFVAAARSLLPKFRVAPIAAGGMSTVGLRFQISVQLTSDGPPQAIRIDF